jgi:hypothetical protein
VPICETCGRNFKTEEILEAHKKQMNHYKVNIPCPVCGRRFPDEKKLAAHMKTHKETSVGCPVCGKRFVDEKKLVDHIKRMHPDFNELPQESPEIKEGGSGTEKPAFEEISKEPAKVADIQGSVPVVEKIIENKKLSEPAGMKVEEQAKAGVEREILDVRPPPKLKPKKFRFSRLGKGNTLLIIYRGKFYFEYVLPDFSPEMQDELAETIADAVVEFIKKHKETTFSIIRAD